MTDSPSLSIDASRKQLSQLTLIRSILLSALWISFIWAARLEQINLTLTALASILILFSLIHTFTFFRIRKSLPVTEIELLIQLFIDILCLSSIFYFTGGANNPFISYLLIPICISATTLPLKYTWLTTITCLTSYTWLLFFYIPMPVFEMNHQAHSSNLNWHIIGMWFNFSISAILITYFIVKMARALQEKNKILSTMREDELRNQQLMAVAILAAGAAHEMNTPLSTMSVLLSELRDEHKEDLQLTADIDVLKQQVKACASTLKNLVQDSSEANEGRFKQQSIQLFCHAIIDRWQLIRPKAKFSISFSDVTEKTIVHDPRLDQAIINLLNNAADASPENIQLTVYCEKNQLIWQIADKGKGISKHIKSKLGKSMQSTKEQGLGIGMLLSHAAIKNYGGNVNHRPNENSGTITELILPLTP